MAFNIDKYRSERREPRTEKIKIPQLAAYFDEGQEPVFVVRGLSAAELGRAREAAGRQRDVAAMASALIGGDTTEKAAALRDIAKGPDVPDDICQRIEMVHMACVDPALQHSDAVLLSEDCPIEFMALSSKVLQLTGAGRQLGKPTASGNRATSAQL